jgi:hypothetical protein
VKSHPQIAPITQIRESQIMKVLRRQFQPLAVGGVLVLLTVSVAAQAYSEPIQKTKSQTQHARSRKPTEIKMVINQFWEGLGRLDSEGMKQLLDWPVTIVEASDTGNKQSVISNPQEFDDAFKRTPEAAVARGKSEFYGTTLSGFNVQMLNANLASVSYACRLPKDIVAKNPSSRPAEFKALTVLRREPSRSNKWRIVFITVPK